MWLVYEVCYFDKEPLCNWPLMIYTLLDFVVANKKTYRGDRLLHLRRLLRFAKKKLWILTHRNYMFKCKLIPIRFVNIWLSKAGR